MIVSKKLPRDNYKAILSTFDLLPEDQYAEPGYRFRRYSQYEFDEWGKLHQLDQPDNFVQSSEINSAFGDIERKFEPIMPGMLTFAGFLTMFDKFREHTGCTKIDCHQVRIVVPVDKPASAAPEGPHQDGYDYIGAFIVTRDNITGGNFMVWEDLDKDPIFEDELEGGYGIIDDRKYYHTGNDLNVVNKSRPGRWEWFVLGGTKSA